MRGRSIGTIEFERLDGHRPPELAERFSLTRGPDFDAILVAINGVPEVDLWRDSDR